MSKPTGQAWFDRTPALEGIDQFRDPTDFFLSSVLTGHSGQAGKS
ncbi:MAG TPA: hypothetical protein VF756_20375 [Thermoanaerobaculia bacterium]